MLLTNELPFSQEPAIEATQSGDIKLNVNNNFNKNDIIILKNHKLELPSELLSKNTQDLIDLRVDIGHLNKKDRQ